jgi:hypothetical protein
VAQQQAQSESGEGESAQGLAAGSRRETLAAQGDKGWFRDTAPLFRGRIFTAVGIVNLVLFFERFHLLIGIAACLSAGSFFIPAWKRSSAKVVDPMRGPVALVLSVWAIGLYGYAAVSPVGGAYNRFTAGFIGTAYVLIFAFEALSDPTFLRADGTRGGG